MTQASTFCLSSPKLANVLKHRIWGILTLLLFVAGCAGGTVTKVVETKELPQELGKDALERYQVREVLPPASPTPTPEPKKKKKVVAAKPKKAAKPAFVYPNRRPPKEAFWIGERQVFEMSYFGVTAGNFTLDVLPLKEMNHRKVYHMKGIAVSSSVFALFYRLNDMVETFIDYEGIFSHKLHLVLDETKQSRDSMELNDSEKGTSFYWNRWNHVERGYVEIKQFIDVAPFSQDTLSALFYIRTRPLNDGDVFEVPVISEGRTWAGLVTVLGREMMSTPLGKIRCIKLKPEAQYKGVLKAQGDSFMWVTDDDRKFLVRLEAKVKIGTVVAALKKVELGTPPDSPAPTPSPIVVSSPSPAP